MQHECNLYIFLFTPQQNWRVRMGHKIIHAICETLPTSEAFQKVGVITALSRTGKLRLGKGTLPGSRHWQAE